MTNLSSIHISKSALLHNLDEFRKITKDSKLVAVVKANAYGHGLKEVVEVLGDRVDYFQVDDLLELREIRKYTGKPVFVLGYVDGGELKEAINLGATFGIFDILYAEKVESAAKQLNKKIKVHLEVDALLGRLGFTESEFKKFYENIENFPHLEIESIYGHFSDIEDSQNLDFAKEQQALLKKVMSGSNISLPFHISATSGILSDRSNWGGSYLRLGIGLYGLWPSSRLKSENSDIDLRPAMSWKTKVAQVKVLPENYPIGYGRTFITKRETKVAVIPQGYSDGFDRKFSNNGEILIGGKRCPVLGRVMMNMFVVDVTEVAGVKAGDEVVILGKQGSDEITAEEMAERIGTINYEIVTKVSSLLPRVVV